MTHQQKFSPRAEHRQQESQRTHDSASLAERFPQLKSMTVNLLCFNPEGVSKSSEIKYTVNLAHARSVFLVDCPNNECIRGDFDLSAELASAVAAKRETMTGEKCCQGWMSKTTIDSVRCRHILRYTFSLGY